MNLHVSDLHELELLFVCLFGHFVISEFPISCPLLVFLLHCLINLFMIHLIVTDI